MSGGLGNFDPEQRKKQDEISRSLNNRGRFPQCFGRHQERAKPNCDICVYEYACTKESWAERMKKKNDPFTQENLEDLRCERCGLWHEPEALWKCERCGAVVCDAVLVHTTGQTSFADGSVSDEYPVAYHEALKSDVTFKIAVHGEAMRVCGPVHEVVGE